MVEPGKCTSDCMGVTLNTTYVVIHLGASYHSCVTEVVGIDEIEVAVVKTYETLADDAPVNGVKAV